jgi:hypothetical protein
MGLQLCRDSGPFDFRDPCIRSSWSALIPAFFVFLLCVSTLPAPELAQKPLDIVKAPFRVYLTLPEAEALDASAAEGDKLGGDEDVSSSDNAPLPRWRALILSWIGLMQTLVWLGVGVYSRITDPSDVWAVLCPVLIACSWLYATARPMSSPMATPPMDLFSLYCLHLVSGTLLFGGLIFDYTITGSPLPHPLVIIALTANLVLLLGLLTVIVSMPMAIPSKRVRKEQILSPIV